MEREESFEKGSISVQYDVNPFGFDFSFLYVGKKLEKIHIRCKK